MLNTPQSNRLSLVLVQPRNPLNIGAAARAMANFGFAHLTVVAPYEDHWREARSAIGAESLLENATATETLEQAIKDCTLVLGTGTLNHRKPEQPVIPLPELPPYIQKDVARDGRVALVFGPEKRGLTRNDLALCHAIVEIPTHPRQPSMNLGQAVAVCLYELAVRTNLSMPAGQPVSESAVRAAGAPATSADLGLLAGVVAGTMQAANYSPAAMQTANRRDLNLMLRRLALTRHDTRRILRLFRRILWRLKHPLNAE